jgi:hypothetical protein
VIKHNVKPLAAIIKARGTQRRAAYVVEGMIAENSVNIGVGDSGLGKSPLAYQMGLCIAAGIEFLGRPTKRGPVLYADLENGEDQFSDIALALKGHLGLTEIPPDFYLLTERDDCDNLGPIIGAIRPRLVIIDSLRAYRPGVEEKNKDAAFLLGMLRDLAKQFATSFLLLHHVRKSSDDENAPAIENTDVMAWLTQACGARAIVNQSDTRIAFGPVVAPKVSKNQQSDAVKQANALRDSVGLVMRWVERSRGQSAPLYLSRVLDGEGEPLGYRAMTGPDLLFNEAMKFAWEMLPRDREFSFTEAKQFYGHAGPATKNWLEKCKQVGCIRQVAKGAPYRVIE